MNFGLCNFLETFIISFYRLYLYLFISVCLSLSFCLLDLMRNGSVLVTLLERESTVISLDPFQEIIG